MIFTLIYQESYLCSHWYMSQLRMHATRLLGSKDLLGHFFAKTMNIANISGCSWYLQFCSIMKKKENAKNLRLKHLPHTPTIKPHPLLALSLSKCFLRAWSTVHTFGMPKVIVTFWQRHPPTHTVQFRQYHSTDQCLPGPQTLQIFHLAEARPVCHHWLPASTLSNLIPVTDSNNVAMDESKRSCNSKSEDSTTNRGQSSHDR